ncbi:SusC/RagA family TonB-linked outer membrane protein [Bacteroidia bacterium]|nr:SusC/RagA family TonB-linked outer membrane protein [Bacteroidia bacterium]
MKTFRIKTLLLGFLFVALPFGLWAQDLNISGTVLDAGNDPVVGVTVMVKGTTTGVTTGINGDYNITAPSDGTLVFSLVGMGTYEEAIAGRGRIDVVLSDNAQAIDEVVVMGYGVQKKKLVTGATVQVGGEDLQKLSTTSALTAMQSQTAGVSIIQSSGQPGEGFKVNIRGIGTTGNSAPLYVIDGVAGGDINNLNPADIESIDVLKDAASAAIYGARSANGVILVTTKGGKLVRGGKDAPLKMSVTYDGYVGFQNVYKMPELLDAKQYMAIMDEVRFNEGGSAWDWQSILGSRYDDVTSGNWSGTNWLNEMRNKNAPIQNHAVNVSGGNDISTFSLGVSRTEQEGIYGYPVQSDYGRTTARLNSDHVILRIGNLDVIKLGETFTYAYSTKSGIGIGDIYWNDIYNMMTGVPIMPLYNDNGEYFAADDKAAMGLNGLNAAFANPIGDMVYRRGHELSKNYNMQASANVQIQPIKDLVVRSQFGYRMSGNTYRQFSPTFKLSATNERSQNEVRQSGGLGWNYTIDNTINYKFAIDENHFDVLLGQSVEKWGMGESMEAFNVESSFNDFEHAYIDNTGAVSSRTSVTGSPWGAGALASFFGRVNYDYNEKYMLSLVMRADGSSNFARGKRWGYFPSVSAGWLLTNETFMEGVSSWMDYFKLRASWGQNGNCNIPNFQYNATVALSNDVIYAFGNNPDAYTQGGYANILPNPDVTWETSQQTDIGFDARFLRSRLNLTFDYYIKETKDWLVRAPVLGAYGMGDSGAPYINGGDVKNQGVEIALAWNDRAGDFHYSAGANLTYNKNEVTRIANSEGIIHGPTAALFAGSAEMYRAQVGYPIGYFYGYKTEGVFQNQADIDAWKAAGKGILQSNPQPGDLKFADLTPDGVIDEKDKTQLGNSHPAVMLGCNLSAGYKGFDLSVAAYGAFGHQIAKSYRKGDNFYENYTSDIYARWHGEGTSNKLPRLMQGNTTNWTTVSDIYIEDGDYFRFQNITLGYDFKHLFPKLPIGQLRLYFTAQNLFTITSYSGADPEVGYSPDGISGDRDSWVSGIDVGYYPNPRTYLFGVNIKF